MIFCQRQIVVHLQSADNLSKVNSCPFITWRYVVKSKQLSIYNQQIYCQKQTVVYLQPADILSKANSCPSTTDRLLICVHCVSTMILCGSLTWLPRNERSGRRRCETLDTRSHRRNTSAHPQSGCRNSLVPSCTGKPVGPASTVGRSSPSRTTSSTRFHTAFPTPLSAENGRSPRGR